MRNAIILHGLPGKNEYYAEKHPSASNSHWLPWLQKHLIINDIKADTPEIPNAETLNKFNMRVQSFLDYLRETSFLSVIIITHGGTINRIQDLLSTGNHQHLSHANASVTHLILS